MTTAYDRFRDEQWPTGTFGHALPPPKPPPPPPAIPSPEEPPHTVEPWTPAEQDAHWAALCNEVGTPGAPRPHLRLIADTDAA